MPDKIIVLGPPLPGDKSMKEDYPIGDPNCKCSRCGKVIELSCPHYVILDYGPGIYKYCELHSGEEIIGNIEEGP